VLAGGLSTRLPGKLGLDVRGEPMLAGVCRRMCGSDRPCLLSVREAPQEQSGLPASIPFVIDRYRDVGPLGGLARAADHVRTPLLFAVAGDLPNIDLAFVESLERAWAASRTRGTAVEAVIPKRSDGTFEPLAALYDTAALARAARAALDAGTRKVMLALRDCAVLEFPVRAEDDWRLANVNTLADYERFKS
jgi:molybdenum cofactor guanylyltransferase